MIDKRNKCEPVILFKITKKEADFVRKLPRTLQDEFEDYQKLKYKFHCLSKLISELLPGEKRYPQHHINRMRLIRLGS